MLYIHAFSLYLLVSIIFISKANVGANLAHMLLGKSWEKRDNDEARVSWKECNLSDGERLDCGYYGVDEDACYKRECCWGESETPGVPWCYHSIPTIGLACVVDPTERMECGWYGIRKGQCLAKKCCWQPTNVDGAPWCYDHKRLPVYAGECGVPAIPPTVLSRIVGGKEAKPNSWPWMVSVPYGGEHGCGGSLVNEQWVITAAHCPPGDYIVFGHHTIYRSGEEPDSSQQTIRVVQNIPHPEYNPGKELDYDLMLMKLEHPVNFTTEVSPVCLPDPGYEIADGRRCYTTGWGHSRSGGESPDKLQQVMVPIINTEKCNQPEWYEGRVLDSMLCAGYEEGGRDSCQNDSGGPLVCYEDSRWTLIGVVSHGDWCAYLMKPGVYSKVSFMMTWIETTIDKHSK